MVEGDCEGSEHARQNQVHQGGDLFKLAHERGLFENDEQKIMNLHRPH